MENLPNKDLIKMMLDHHLINYVDHETPRHYFLDGNATEEDLYAFTEALIKKCADIAINCSFTKEGPSHAAAYQRFLAGEAILTQFGIKSSGPISHKKV